MDITLAKKDLLPLLSKVQAVTARKPIQPALAFARLTAHPTNSLEIAAQDLSRCMWGTVPCEVKEHGAIALPAEDLLDRVKSMPDGHPIRLALGKNATVTISAKGVQRKHLLRGMPAAEYPALPQPAEGAPTLSLDAEVLRKLIAMTSFAISSDESRPNVNTATFEWKGDRVSMFTFDGHRLTLMRVKVEGRSADAKLLLSQKAIGDLKKLSEEAIAETPKDKPRPQLRITQSGTAAYFEFGGLTFGAKLVQTETPPYEHLIPQQLGGVKQRVRVLRAALADALRSVSLASMEKHSGVLATFDGGTLRLSSESPEGGESSDDVPVEHYHGEKERSAIGLAAKYFLEALGVFDEDTVDIAFSHDLNPVIVRPTSDLDYVSLIMPMKLESAKG